MKKSYELNAEFPISQKYMRTAEEIDILSSFHTSGYEDFPVIGKCNKFNARKNEGVPLYIVRLCCMNR